MDIIPFRKKKPTAPPAPVTLNSSAPPQTAYTPPIGSNDSGNKKDTMRSVVSTIALFGTALLIAILLNTFVIQSYQVDGMSMENTLQNDDRLIVNKVPRTWSRLTGHQYVPHRGDIIIFNEAGLPGFVGTKQLIKRVIGLPGEHVVVSNGRITVYNKQNPQGFDPDDSGKYKTSSPVTVGDVDVTLKSNEIFVCGDNRPNSEDSRYFGPINTNQIVAKLVLRIMPVDKVQKF